MKPINGDPGKVASSAKELQEAAETMRAAARRLSGLIAGEFTSEATDQLAINADEIAAAMSKAATRYQGTGDALAAYAPVLAQCQDDVARAISLAGTVDVRSAQHVARVAEAADHATQHDPFVNDSDKAQSRAHALNAAADLEHQMAVANHAQALYDSAMATLEQAAAAAIAGIHDAAELSGLNDSWIDDIDHFVHHELSDALSLLHVLLGAISDACAGIALILAVCGLVHLAGIVKTIGTVTALLDIAVQSVRFLIGDITLGELLLTAAWTLAKVFLISKLAPPATKASEKVLADLAKKEVLSEVEKKAMKDAAVNVALWDAESGYGVMALEWEATPRIAGRASAIEESGGGGLLFSRCDITTHEFHPLAGTGEDVDAAQIVHSNFAVHVPVTLHSAGSGPAVRLQDASPVPGGGQMRLQA